MDITNKVLVARVESAVLSGARKFLEKKNFIEFNVPHLTKATGSCENIDTLFEVDYFGDRVYLAQTGQLYLEALIPNIERVWCIGPSFRAEEEVDNRHLTEFPLLELEFAGNFEELVDMIQKLVYEMIKEVKKQGIVKNELLDKVKLPFKRITYTEAIEMLREQGVKWGDDLKSRHEQFLVRKMGNTPLFITHYPKKIKFFNMRTNEKNSKIVNSTDLILPMSGEAVGAAEREFEYESLLKKLTTSQMMKQLEAKGGSIEDFRWYLDHIKNRGSVLHSGCGIGLNRIVQFVLGNNDIRQCAVYPLNSETIM